MGILDEVTEQNTWERFYADRQMSGRMPKKDLAALRGFIDSRRYEELADTLLSSGKGFSLPTRSEVNKMGARRKRVVYSFTPDENLMLKGIAFLLHRYDGQFAANCYAFRKDLHASRAIKMLSEQTSDMPHYWHKLDICDYFNSVDVDLLLPMLEQVLSADKGLFAFMKQMLLEDRALVDGSPVTLKRGIMAGTPVSPFLANVYLSNLDQRFAEQGIVYARYSDDIILFARSQEQADVYAELAAQAIKDLNLAINEEKACSGGPDDPWSFLGVECCGGTIDLSAATLQKLKGKLRRKSRALHRWKLRKDATDERAMRAFVRSVNRKLYANREENDLTWARWFFPLITSDARLHEVDRCIRDGMRYVATGRYNKGNYRIRTEHLKELGYINTVNEYHKYRSAGFRF